MSDPQRIKSSFHCTIKTLTPLHIGSGEVFKKGFDFLAENGEIRVISQVMLFHYLMEIGFKDKIKPFMKAIEEKCPLTWLRDNGISLHDMEGQLSMAWPETPDEIRAQIRDGLGNPLLPGSSLKGAIRTAILKRLSNENAKEIVNKTINDIKKNGCGNLKEADKKIRKELLGEDPTNSLMRTLSTGDFTFSPGDVLLQKVEVSREVSQNMMKRKPRPQSDQPMQITVEKIKENSVSRGRIFFDNSLYARDKKTEKFCLGFRSEIGIGWLVSAIRSLTESFIAGEIAYLSSKKGSYVLDLLAFYRDLQQKAAALGDKEVLLNLGWGIGWRGTTGELVDDNDLSADEHKLRINFKLATKHCVFPFPKSRRVAISGNKVQPMGWIRLAFLPIARED
jgi:CRISPR-associated protein Csm5